MKTDDADMEKICLNCGAFFPASFEMPDDFGICLNDPEFDPFLDDILDHEDFTSCQELVERKKINGERDACSDFEPIEYIEIKDDTPLGRDLKRVLDAGQQQFSFWKPTHVGAAFEPRKVVARCHSHNSSALSLFHNEKC